MRIPQNITGSEAAGAPEDKPKVSSLRIGFHFGLIYIAAVLAAIVVLLSGWIPEWGHWYSPALPLRYQTEALLQGNLAFDGYPDSPGYNLVWDNNRVQQVWGLGVPLWRMPFELLAKGLGRAGFPDRVVLWIAVVVLAYVVIRAFAMPRSCGDLASWRDHLRRQPEGMAIVLLLLFFPPFLRLAGGTIWVYQEIQVYSFLAGIGLLAATTLFVRSPKWLTFIVVAILAGTSPLIRPTLGVYGVASLSILLIHARHLNWPRRRLWIGVALFAAGGALLFSTNLHRFGSGFEFGHSLNLNPDSSMRFVTRFDNPYREEPFRSATAELGTWLFFVDYSQVVNGRVPAGKLGESERFRYRYFDTPTFDLSYLIALAVLAAWFGRRCWHRLRRPNEAFSEAELLAFWCFACILPLFIFYLGYPALYSRYLLDFAPAFAAGLIALAYAVPAVASTRLGLGIKFRYCFAAGIALWLLYQLFGPAGKETPTASRLVIYQPLAYAGIVEKLKPGPLPFKPLPEFYSVGMDFNDYGIPFNGSGWNPSSGQTRSAISLLVENPEYLELKVAPVEGVDLGPEDYRIIQAKVGLEFLELESIREKEEGVVLLFSGPKRLRYQEGVQIAFMGFVTPEEVTGTGLSKFRLLSVHWRGLD